MKLDNSTYSVDELRDILGREDLVENLTYQRGAGLWVLSARTVLSDMDAELSALEARRDKTRDLKQAMMQELLIGRTRLI